MHKQTDFDIINMRKCNRKILNGYWLCFIISIIAEILYINDHKENMSFLYAVFIPYSIIIIIITLSEIFNKYFKNSKINPYLIIVSGVLIADTFAITFSQMHNILSIFFLPLLISIFYFNKKKFIFSYLMTVLSFNMVFFITGLRNGTFEVSDYITIVAILSIGVITLLYIMKNGIQILNDLKSTTEDKQELLVRNIIMDKLYKTDPLTELYNHITFHEYLDELIKKSVTCDFSIQLAIIDIDNFKQINDNFGHRVGDVIIKKISKLILDSVTNDDFVARYGGEEFAIIFTDKHFKNTYNKIENMRKKIEETTYAELNNSSVTISIGFHNFLTGTTKEDFFKDTDNLLYIAKRTGKNKTVLFEDMKIL
jgi:diguanylate cyclase (GGDEF)-like protein